MDAQAELLRAMYRSFYDDEESFDITGFFRTGEIKWLPDGRRAADALDDNGMIESGFRYQGIIKAKGILHAEAQGLIDDETLAAVREARRKLLEAVAELEAGSGRAQRGRVFDKAGMREDEGRPHMRMAEGGGWVQSAGPGFITLTGSGADALGQLRG